jgi:hypothetical protein
MDELWLILGTGQMEQAVEMWMARQTPLHLSPFVPSIQFFTASDPFPIKEN